MQHESAVKNAEPKASHGNLKSADGTTRVGQPPLLAASDSRSILQRAQEDPLSLTHADLQRLQATAGPQAVQRLLARDDVRQARRIDVSVPEFRPMPQVQAKLSVGPAGDRYEQEADRVASQVVNMPTPALTQGIAGPSAVQREEEGEDELQMKSLVQREEVGEDELQMKSLVQRASEGGFEAGSDFEKRLNKSKGGGAPLPGTLRADFEPKFGVDFSRVRTHTDAQSDQLNRSIQAKAFTTGNDIFFRKGQYDPGNRGGKELLAHELTHVVQQNGADVTRRSEKIASVEKRDRARISNVKSFSPDPASPTMPLLRKSVVRSSTTGVDRIQRNGGGGSSVKQQVQEAVAALPVVPEEQFPEAAEISAGLKAGAALNAELEAVTQKNQPLAQIIMAELKPEAALESIPEGVEDEGGVSGDNGPGANASQLSAALEDQAVDAPEEQSMNGEASQASRANWDTAKKAGNVGKTAGGPVNTFGVGGTATVMGLATEKGSALAATAGIMGQVAGVVGAVFALISSFFDFKSAVSSRKKYKNIKAMVDEMGEDVDPEMKKAVTYAMNQKYAKAYTRAVKAAAAFVSAGVGISLTAAAITAGVTVGALVASGPVGWAVLGVAAGLAAVVGLGIMVYKIGKKLWKSKKGILGVERRRVAMLLYTKLRAGDNIATQAINLLVLDAAMIKAAAEEGAESEKQRTARISKQYQHKLNADDARWAVEQKKKEIVEHEWILERLHKGGGMEKNIADRKTKLQQAQLELQSLMPTQTQTQQILDWKTLTKSQRRDVKMIEAKLKK